MNDILQISVFRSYFTMIRHLRGRFSHDASRFGFFGRYTPESGGMTGLVDSNLDRSSL